MADYLGFAFVNVMFVLYVYFAFKMLGFVSRTVTKIVETLEKILRRLDAITNILGDIVDKRTEVKKGED